MCERLKKGGGGNLKPSEKYKCVSKNKSDETWGDLWRAASLCTLKRKKPLSIDSCGKASTTQNNNNKKGHLDKMNYFYIIKMNNILELSDSIGFFLMIS